MSTRHLAIGAIALVALVASPAIASTTDPQTADFGNFYAGIDAGALIPNSISTTITGTLDGVALAGSGNENLDTGPAVSGIFGYHINDYFAVEGELAYASLGWDSLSGSFTSGGTSVSGSIGLSRSEDTVAGLANFLVAPLGAKSRFSPYLGAGLGFANYDSKTTAVTIDGTSYSNNISNSATVLAAHAVLGLDHAVTDNVSLGGRYQFMWADSGKSYTSGGVVEQTGNFTGNILTAQATYHF